MKVLIIAQNEISHNPRLLKAADFFLDRKWDVTVVNGVTGFGERKSYERIKDSRNWKVIENILDKRNRFYRLKWALISILHKAIYFTWARFRYTPGYSYVLNKGLLFAKFPDHYFDIILINLVDTLPIASKIKKKTGSRCLIYDSQEYFEGQYQKYKKEMFDWVVKTEDKYVESVDLILGTTDAMVNKLETKFKDKPIIRVRNIPSQPITIKSKIGSDKNKLKIIWHGMSVNYNNCRGVHIIVRAIGQCNSEVELTLQGKSIEKDFIALKKEAKKLGVLEKIIFKDPVAPDEITESLIAYDIGVTGELPEEENQLLTSSNKLFEYIHAGLCTVVPSLPGLKETIDTYHTGVLYESGNPTELASVFDRLNKNRKELQDYKYASKTARHELIWEKDYDEVLQKLNHCKN